MNDSREQELERWAEAQLKRLSDWPAPATLIPRVQARLAAAPERPAPRGLWASWPAPWRTAFVFALASLMAVLGWLGDQATNYVASASNLHSAFPLDSIERLSQIASVLKRALVLSLSAVPAWCGWAALGCALVMYGLSLALGTLCYRLALQR